MNHPKRRRESSYGGLTRTDTDRRGSILQSFTGQEPKNFKAVKIHEVEASFDISMLMLDGYVRHLYIFPARSVLIVVTLSLIKERGSQGACIGQKIKYFSHVEFLLIAAVSTPDQNCQTTLL
jgi:hypothetical protein